MTQLVQKRLAEMQMETADIRDIPLGITREDRADQVLARQNFTQGLQAAIDVEDLLDGSITYD